MWHPEKVLVTDNWVHLRRRTVVGTGFVLEIRMFLFIQTLKSSGMSSIFNSVTTWFVIRASLLSTPCIVTKSQNESQPLLLYFNFVCSYTISYEWRYGNLHREATILPFTFSYKIHKHCLQSLYLYMKILVIV